jgi:hypothetical protein
VRAVVQSISGEDDCPPWKYRPYICDSGPLVAKPPGAGQRGNWQASLFLIIICIFAAAERPSDRPAADNRHARTERLRRLDLSTVVVTPISRISPVRRISPPHSLTVRESLPAMTPCPALRASWPRTVAWFRPPALGHRQDVS